MAKIENFEFVDKKPHYKARVDSDFRIDKNGTLFEICTYKEGDKKHIDKKQVIDLDKKISKKLVIELIKYFKFTKNDFFK